MLLGLSFELGNKKLPELHQSVFVEGPNPPIPPHPSPAGLPHSPFQVGHTGFRLSRASCEWGQTSLKTSLSTAHSSACPNPCGSERGVSPAAIVSWTQLMETDKEGLANSKEIQEFE